MKKALSCLGLALALVSIPQLVSADDAAKAKEVVAQEQNATTTVEKTAKKAEKAADEATKKVVPVVEEASKN